MITQRQAQFLMLAVALTAFVAYVVPFDMLVQWADADRSGTAPNRSDTGAANCKSKINC